MVLDCCAALGAPLPVRWACLGHDLGKGTTPPAEWPRHIGHEIRSAKLVRRLGQRLRVSVECSELADVVAREHGNVHRSGELGASAVLRLLDRCDALRRPQRFADLLLACECDARGRLGRKHDAYAPARRLPPLLQAALAVDSAAVAGPALERGLAGPAVGELVRAARTRALACALAADL